MTDLARLYEALQRTHVKIDADEYEAENTDADIAAKVAEAREAYEAAMRLTESTLDAQEEAARGNHIASVTAMNRARA